MNARANAERAIARSIGKVRPVLPEPKTAAPTTWVFICRHCVEVGAEETMHRANHPLVRYCPEGKRWARLKSMSTYYAHNRATRIARSSTYQRNNRQSRTEYQRKWRNEHAERFREIRRVSYHRHAEAIRGRSRAYYHANKDTINARRAANSKRKKLSRPKAA